MTDIQKDAPANAHVESAPTSIGSLQVPLGDDPEFQAHASEVLGRFRRMCPPGQAPVLTILRVHLLTEYYIERLLTMSLPRGDKLTEDANLSYAQKLAILDSLKVLDDQHTQALRALNRVRNSCAHEMDRDITLSDVERIGSPLGPTFTTLRRQFANDIESLLTETLSDLTQTLTYHIWQVESEVAARHKKRTPEP